MTFIDFLNGNVLDETGLDTMMRQGVIRFSTTSQLTSQLGSGIRENGMMAYSDDTQTVYMWNGTNWIPFFSAEKSASVAFTAGGTNVTVGNSTVVTKYQIVGGMVKFTWQFVIGSTANMQSGALAMGLPPIAIHPDHQYSVIGQASFYDTSAANMYYRACVNIGNTTNIAFIDTNATRWSTTTPTAFGVGDVLNVNCLYRPTTGIYL